MPTILEDPAVDMITVDGTTTFEVTVSDPDGEGFLAERIPVREESDRREVEEQIEEAKRRLLERQQQREEPEEDWRAEFESLADEA